MSRIYSNHELRIRERNRREALEREASIAKNKLSEFEREKIAAEIEDKYSIRKYKDMCGNMYTFMPETTFKAVVETVFRQLEIKKILTTSENLSEDAKTLIKYLIEPALKLDYYDIVNIPCTIDLKEP